MSNVSAQFESFEKALSFACMNLSLSTKESIRNSKIYKNMKEQMRITDFFSNNKNA
jgi:DNA repair protein NreA